MSVPAVGRPAYLPLAGGTVLSFLHPPAAGAERDVAVLLVPPFGWEDDSTYRTRRIWADRLAFAGVATLRLDLPGTGDSTGERALGAWTSALAEAAALLREAASARRVVAVGLGLGGLLAVQAAVEGARIDDFVLWGAPARGRSAVRELRAFANMEAAADLLPDGMVDPVPEGAMHVGGYTLPAALLDDLGGVDLSAAELPAAESRRALLLGRDGLPADARLVAGLERAGVAVTTADGAGYGDMLQPPHLAVEPVETIVHANAWMADGAGAGQPVAPLRGAQDTLTLHVDGVDVVERPFTFERADGGRTFGILVMPADGPAELGALLLNAGAIRRTGPNRLWVDLARHWATWKVAVARLDLESIGDADGEPHRTLIPEQYGGDFERQVQEAVEHLAADGVADGFVSAGVCSGGYWSLHAAVREPRIRSVYMINPRVLVWAPDVIAGRVAGRLSGVASAEKWRKALRGELEWSRVREAVSAAGEQVRHKAARRRRRLNTPGEDDQVASTATVEAVLDRLRDNGTALELVFAGWEPLRDELQRDGHIDSMAQWPNVRLSLLGGEGDTHTLRPAWLQAEIRSMLDAALSRELDRERTRTASGPRR